MGNSRSGKTMLARQICTTLPGYSLISLDYLVMTFKKVFPDLKIDYYGKEETIFTKFVETYLDNCTYKSGGINYILEGAAFPEKVIERLNANPNNKVIFLGKPNLSPQEFFEEIRKYENGLTTGGWTKKLDDKILLSWCSDWIKKAKKQQKYCEQNNILFFDTSYNQQEVLNKIIDGLAQKEQNKPLHL